MGDLSSAGCSIRVSERKREWIVDGNSLGAVLLNKTRRDCLGIRGVGHMLNIVGHDGSDTG